MCIRDSPVFSVPGSYRLEHGSSLIMYALLGVAAAVLSRGFYSLLLTLRARMRNASPAKRAVLPALGGLGTGVLGVVVGVTLGARGVLGDGYATLSAALVGDLSLQVMVALVVAKLLATALCYSSGGAGGIFAPVLFIGGMLGGVFGHIDQALFTHANNELGAFALVGMGAFFAAVIQAAGEVGRYGDEAEWATDQREDDGGSLVFLTEPLAEKLEILGAPLVHLRFSSDKPQALVCARLNDVAPDGRSTRVTVGLLNLTRYPRGDSWANA